MIANSTILYIADDPRDESKTPDPDDYDDIIEYDRELGGLLNDFDYSPSEQAIRNILNYAQASS